MPDPGLMPLPDTAADLDWSNLVDAAKAYEGESADHPGRTRRATRPCRVLGGVRLWLVCPLCCFAHTDRTGAGGVLPAGALAV